MYKDTIIYKSDEDIEKEFDGYRIQSLKFHSDCSGQIILEFPEAGESVYGGQECFCECCEYFIYYSHNGKIAFDHWYPEKIYKELCRVIRTVAKRTNVPLHTIKD